MNLWPSIWTHVEKNEGETLANNVSPFNVERLRRTVSRAEALHRVMPFCASDDGR